MSARSSGWASAASAGATSRSSGCRPASRPSGSTAGPRPGPSSSGWSRIAVSITHEADYAVAIAFGVRTAGGRYVFPPDIEERLDDRERRILARMERLRGAPRRVGTTGRGARDGRWLTGRSASARREAGATARRSSRRSRARSTLDDAAAAALLPERPKRGHKGAFGKVLVVAGSLDYAGAALLVCRAAGRAGAGLVTLAVPESLQPLFAAKVVEATTMALPEDDVEEVDPEPALARILDHEHDALVVGPGLRPGLATAELVRALLAAPDDDDAAADRPRRRGAAVARHDGRAGGRATAGRRVLTPHAGEFERLRAGSGRDPATTATSSATTRPARRPPATPPRRGARSSC